MTRQSDRQERRIETVRLAPADWGGLCSLALAMLALAGATLYKVHEIAQTNRERLAAVDAEIVQLRQTDTVLREEVRILRRGD